MEANYSNYDRSQIKLIFKAPNKPQRVLGFVLFCFFTSLLPRKERKEGRKSSEAVGLTGEDRKRNSCPFSKRWGRETEKEKQKCKRIKTIASIIFLSTFYILYLDF